MNRPKPDVPYYIGLDLGQQSDYTALTVVQPVRADTSETEYHLRHIERFALGTPYRTVAARTCAVQEALDGESYVLADATGVGRPVIEMLEAEGVKDLRSITITGGDTPSRDGGEHRVPKRDLASVLQVLLQSKRLKFANGLEGGHVLRAELQNFKVKINIATGHDSYEAWREGEHDDLVLSLAMACWYAEHGPRPAFVGALAPFRGAGRFASASDAYPPFSHPLVSFR